MPANNSKYFPANARPGSAAVRTFLSLSKTPWQKTVLHQISGTLAGTVCHIRHLAWLWQKLQKQRVCWTAENNLFYTLKKTIFFLKVLFGTKQRRNMSVGNIFVP